MSENTGITYLTCLPQVEMCMGFFSLRLGSLLISIYSILHALFAGYNEDLLRRRELELNLNAAFCVGLAIVSFMLMIGVFLEKQGVCLLWLWYTVLMVVPMLVMMVLCAKIHLEMQDNTHAVKNIISIAMHTLMFYYIVVVHSYRLEIELLDMDIDFDDD